MVLTAYFRQVAEILATITNLSSTQITIKNHAPERNFLQGLAFVADEYHFQFFLLHRRYPSVDSADFSEIDLGIKRVASIALVRRHLSLNENNINFNYNDP